MASTQLIPSISVQSLIQERQHRIEVARQLLASKDARHFFEFLNSTFSNTRDEVRLENYIQSEDRRCWSQFIRASGLWDLFPRTVREQWARALRWGDYRYHNDEVCPQFTAAAALATFETYATQRKELRAQAITELYRRLSWDHKTNNPALFGKKLIYKTFFDHHGHTSSYARNAMDDLLRTLRQLDGKPEHVGLWSQSGNADGYFEVRLFKNGNGHIHIHRLDLVDKLNAELAQIYPGALPAPRKA